VADAARGFDLRRFLANAHAVAAGAWLVGMGLFPAMEGIAFAALCVMTAIRWRETGAALADRSIRAPILLLACLLGWMIAACAWGESGVPFEGERPNRTFLGVVMVVGAAMPTWGILASISIAGLWWCASAAALRAGWHRPAPLVPSHVSATFLGFAGLAATGIACLVGDRRRTVRALGAAVLAAAILGISVFASRGSLVGTIAALACCLLAAAARRSNWRTPLAIAVGVLAIAVLLLPSMPIWRKATASISRDVAALPDDRPLSFMDVYRVANPARAALHSWTAERISERPVFGHGARTWSADHARWKSEADRADSAAPAPKPARQSKSPPRPPNSAHSLYLEAAYEYGAVGVLLLAGTLAALGTAAARAGSGARASAALALVAMTAVVGLGDLVLNSRPMAARMAAMLALAACARLPSSQQCTRP
jgi:hypothetical protein